MTYAEAIAAEIAARYGVPVMPGAFQRIPRGVSGLPDPLAPVPLDVSRKRYMAAHYAGNANRARTARLRRAEEAAQAEQAAAQPKPAPLTPDERAARDKARKADARHAAAVATEAKLRAMEGQPVEAVAAALGFTVAGTRKLATQKGVRLIVTGAATKTKVTDAERTANHARAVAAAAEANRQRRIKRDDAIRALADGIRTRAQIAAMTGEKPWRVDKVLVGYVCAGDEPSPPVAPPDAVQAALDEGLTLAQIAVRLQCSDNTISKRIKDHGLKRAFHPPKEPASAKERKSARAPVQPKISAYKQRRMDRESAVRAAAKTLPTISAVSRATGLKRATVQRVMAELGIACGGTRLYEDRDREIYREWRAGNAYRALATRYGLAKSNIHRIVMREKSLDAP